MRIEQDRKLHFDDVYIRPKRSNLSSRRQPIIWRDFVFPHTGAKYKGVPILASNMDTIGTFAMAKELEAWGCSVVLHKFYSNDDLENFFRDRWKERESKNLGYKLHNSEQLYFEHWISTGITEENFEKVRELTRRIPVKYLCIDVANGYQEIFVESVKRYRDLLQDSVIMAGNVVTGDMTEALILAGVDVVKVGIGSGNVCITTKVTGVGYPQLSAVIECSDAAHGLKGLVCSDGGIKYPGDLAKAFAGGADFCMIGSSFGGHDESGGEIIEQNGKTYMKIYGMSSTTAQLKHYGIKPNYRASEGVEKLVEYKGPIENTLVEFLGGLRSTLTYVGAQKLKELSKRTTFVIVK